MWHRHPLVCSPASKAGTPRTSRILAVFDPTTLPKARPGLPSSTALTEISNSGADVPKATIVRLTINAGMPTRRLRFTAPLTSASPPRSRITRPRPDKSQGIIMFCCPSYRHMAPCQFDSARMSDIWPTPVFFAPETAVCQTWPTRPSRPKRG